MAFHGIFPYWKDQNVFWTFCIGFLVIWGLEKLYRTYWNSSNILGRDSERREEQVNRTLRYCPAVAVFAALCLVMIGMASAHFLEVDYGVYGFLLILLFYLGEHGNVPRIVTCVCGYLLFLWEPYCLGGFLLILFYNGKRKHRGKGFQYFFYLFYPLHLMILGLIRVVFWPG